MVGAGILTLILPAGSYQRVVVDGRETLVPDSFSFTEAPSYPWWRWFIAPLEVLGGPDGLTVMVILAFILVVGAAFAVMDKSGILEAVLARIVRRFEGRKYLLLVVVSFFFMAVGAFFGIFEEVVPLVPLMIALSYSLGWDAMTGLGMSILATNMGFSAAVINPFTVGVAQGTFTAAFLLTAGQRKGIFGPLLQVDDYQKAVDKLLEPLRLVLVAGGVVSGELVAAAGDVTRLRVSRMFVDGLVEAPNGAHPTSCDPDYRRDEAFQKTYLGTAKDPALWEQFRTEWLTLPTEAGYQAALTRGCEVRRLCRAVSSRARSRLWFGRVRALSTRVADLLLGGLPAVELASCVVQGWVRRLVVVGQLRRQLDHVSVRVAKVDRVDKVMIRDASRLDAVLRAFREHALEVGVLDLQRDVQVVVVLRLELERLVGHLEEREVRAVVEPIKRVQRLCGAPRLGLADHQRRGER